MAENKEYLQGLEEYIRQGEPQKQERGRACRLRTAIELADLIGEAVTPRWSIDFSNIKQWQRNRYDTRGVKLTLRYTFNSVSTSFRDAQINKSSDGRVD